MVNLDAPHELSQNISKSNDELMGPEITTPLVIAITLGVIHF